MSCIPLDKKPQCKWLTCIAGMGVAGMGVCFLHGDTDNPKCSKYENETEFLERWKNADENLSSLQGSI
jgi:hypothetical protein